MQTNLKTFGASALLSLLLILPFIVMEVVNRREFHEDFPFMLFFVMWFNLFAISLILLPVVRGRRVAQPRAASHRDSLKGGEGAGDHAMANPVPAQGDTLLTNPRPAALISIVLFLIPIILTVLDRLGWLPLQAVFNGPDPEQLYVPGLFLSLALFSLPVAAGVIARGLIVRTVRAGESLFAYPVHLIIVVFLVSTMAYGLASLIIDQWPCFIGVPVCD